MKKIKMIETRRGTEDGFTIRCFQAGQEYIVQDHLAKSFFAAGWAMIIRAKKRKKK